MKKSLLLCMAAAACMGTSFAQTETPETPAAQTPTILDGMAIHRISANGKIAMGEYGYEGLFLYNLEDGEYAVYVPEEGDWTTQYYFGNGNCLSADGSVLVGATSETAAYLKDGEWHALNVPDEEKSNAAHGITPDASRICGSIGLKAISLEEDNIMVGPAYWDLQSDGTYGDCQPLPYPAKDFFNEVPQYVNAIAISDDGKTIVGQVTFNSGMMQVPIVYTQDAKGDWTYSLPTKDLFNPEHLAPVENPGEGPAQPSQEGFMTEEELAAYYKATSDYFSGDRPSYPEYDEFMTEAEKEAYDKAFEAWETENEEWSAKFDAYMEYREKVIAASPNFSMNNMFISKDGKTVYGSLEKEDENAGPSMTWPPMPSMAYTPCSVDVATGELTQVETDKSIQLSFVAEDGTMLGSNDLGSTPMKGYIIKDGNVQDIDQYIISVRPDYKEWINENLLQETQTGFDENEDEIWEELMYTGILCATPDLKTIGMFHYKAWDGTYDLESVVFDLSANSGILAIKHASDISVDTNGNIKVPAGYSSLSVYNISGARVKNVANPAGVIDLKLSKGLYIVKGTRTDGTASVLKVVK